MELSGIVYLAQKGLWLSLILSMPVLLVTVLVGLIVSVFQAATQVQEQGLPMVLKLIAGTACLLMVQGWLGVEIKTFAEQIFGAIRLGQRP